MNEFPWIGPTDWALLLTSPIVLYLGVLTASSFRPKSLNEKDLSISIFNAPSQLHFEGSVSVVFLIPLLPQLLISIMISFLLAVVLLAAYCYSALLTLFAASLIELVIGLFSDSYEITKGWPWVITFNAFLLIVAAVSSRLQACLTGIKQREALINAIGNHFRFGRDKNNGKPISLTEEKFTELCDSSFPRREWNSF